LIVEVEDEGPGIPEDDLPHIFKDFFRASNVSSIPGVGLGLSIAKKIVEAHNGQIFVENLSNEQEKKGTRFTIIMPLNLQTPEVIRQGWLTQSDEDEVNT
jgi:signal transduction histidine kinase